MQSGEQRRVCNARIAVEGMESAVMEAEAVTTAIAFNNLNERIDGPKQRAVRAARARSESVK